MTLLYGFLIALAIIAISALALMKIKGGGFTIFAAVVGVALLAFLTFETSRLIKDIQQRRNVDKVMSFVESTLIATNTVLPEEIQSYTFGPLESQGIVWAVKGFDCVNHSTYAKYIDVSDFTGKSWVSVTDAFQKIVKRESGKKIAIRIGWCVLAIGLAVILVLFFGKKKVLRDQEFVFEHTDNFCGDF